MDNIEVETPESAEVESTEQDVDLEDIEVSVEDMGETPLTDSESEDEEAEAEETESEETEEESEDEEDTEQKEEPTEELSDEEQRKAFNREMAERRIQAKAEREAAIKEQQQAYVAEADPDDPRDVAVRQLQVDAYNTKVEGNTNKLTNGYERAIKDFDIFTSPTPEIQRALDDAIDEFQARYVEIDAYGNPGEVRGDLYSFLQTKADSIKQLTSIGAREQGKSKSKEKSKTFTPPTRAPKTPKVDPDLAAFDEEVSKW